jgi:hypothetical protein
MCGIFRMTGDGIGHSVFADSVLQLMAQSTLPVAENVFGIDFPMAFGTPDSSSNLSPALETTPYQFTMIP